VATRAPGKAEKLRRRLSVSSVESAGSNSQCPEEDDDTADEDRSLLMSLTSQQLMDIIQAKTEAPAVGKKRYSIGSETDASMKRVQSFCSKTARSVGDAYSPENEGIGYACKKGLKPEAPNQDSFLICKVEGMYSIYGVFDGHGRKGHDISNFVKDHLPKLIVSHPDILDEPIKALQQTFDKTQRLIEQATNLQRIDANRSGTTASVCLHDHKKRMLYLAHVGDSRCVLAKRDPTAVSSPSEWQAIDLTEDHKPNLPAEKARIEKHGGQVIFDGAYNYRVYAKGKRYPGLNMSRAMGDLKGFHNAGISAVPDVAGRPIAYACDRSAEHSPRSPKLVVSSSIEFRSPENSPMRSHERRPSGGAVSVPGVSERDDHLAEVHSCTSIRSTTSCAPSLSSHSIDPARDKFLLMCSDGIWEFMTSEEAVHAVAPFRNSEAMGAAENLASCAWDRWMQNMQGEVVDDITALVIHLDVAH